MEAVANKVLPAVLRNQAGDFTNVLCKGVGFFNIYVYQNVSFHLVNTQLSAWSFEAQMQVE